VNAVRTVSYNKNNRGNYYSEDVVAEGAVQTYTFDPVGYAAADKMYDKEEFGFIAQEVLAALPVGHNTARIAFHEDDARHGHDTVRFTEGDMIPILWNAVQELTLLTEQLTARLELLETPE
jgi:hypothetical protein